MPAFQYNSDNQKKFTPTANEPFMKGVPKEKVFVPTSGIQHRLRILPPWSATGLFARFAKTHWRVGVQGKAFACPDMWEEGSCPFCRLWAQLRQQYDLYQVDVLAIRATPRYYSNIVNVTEPAKGVMVYTYGKRVYQMIKGIQDAGSFGDITDAINGCDLILQRTGAGMQIQDVIYPIPQHSPIQNPDWLDQLYDLDDLFITPDMEDVEACFKSHPWQVYNPAAGRVTETAKFAYPPPPPGVPFVAPAAKFAPPPPVATGTGAPISYPIPSTTATPLVTPSPVVAAPAENVAMPVPVPAASIMGSVQSLEDKIRAKLTASKPV